MLSKVSSYAICRGMVAFVWFYHGLVPKLLGPHADELRMNLALGLNRAHAEQLSRVAGVCELLFALLIVVCWRQRWPLVVTAVAMVGLLLFSLVAVPSLAMAAFNPVTTNLLVLALSVVALRLQGAAQTASR